MNFRSHTLEVDQAVKKNALLAVASHGAANEVQGEKRHTSSGNSFYKHCS